MDSAVTVTDLVVDRGHRRVLDGLSFSVPTGQVTGLLGPSGSGKTTLMRALVGVQKVRSGAVTVLGSPAGSPGLRARVGYVTQAPSVYADLSVRENARYFAALYGLGAGVTAALQAGLTVTVATTLYGLDIAGSVWLVVLIAVVDAVLGVALGLLASAFARTEFQAVQFMPVIVLPQFFLCGLLVARDQMADWLRYISDVLPLTYAVEALQEVGRSAAETGTMWRDLGIVAGAAVLALALAAATLRRRTS